MPFDLSTAKPVTSGRFDLATAKPVVPVQQDSPGILDSVKQGAINLGAGAIRGAGSIGATLLWPIDKATDLIMGDRDPNVAGLISGKQPISRNEQRRRDIDEGLSMLVGSDPNSLLYKTGKLGGEVAGTAGAGGLLGNGARLAGASPELVASLASGGMRTGGVTGLASSGVRAVGGATTGAATAGLINPNDMGAGAVVGAALPGVAKVMGVAGKAVDERARNLAEQLMQSAIKPTIKQRQTGEAATAVNTLLDYGISPTMAGTEKIRGLVDALNNQISDKIANSNAVVDKNAVLGRLLSVQQKFGNQVSPTADLNAIQGVADDFSAHPNFPGLTIPVQAAQDMKQATYQVLAKKYGQMGSADVEAQKALARGLKEEIATAVPEVAGLNAEESRLLKTLKVSERRALMEANKNPGGISLLAKNPMTWALFMADRSAAFKALAARMVNSAGGAAGNTAPALEAGLSNPVLRGGAVQLPAARDGTK